MRKVLLHVVRWIINVWLLIMATVNFPLVVVWNLLTKIEKKLSEKNFTI